MTADADRGRCQQIRHMLFKPTLRSSDCEMQCRGYARNWSTRVRLSRRKRQIAWHTYSALRESNAGTGA